MVGQFMHLAHTYCIYVLSRFDNLTKKYRASNYVTHAQTYQGSKNCPRCIIVRFILILFFFVSLIVVLSGLELFLDKLFILLQRAVTHHFLFLVAYSTSHLFASLNILLQLNESYYFFEYSYRPIMIIFSLVLRNTDHMQQYMRLVKFVYVDLYMGMSYRFTVKGIEDSP